MAGLETVMGAMLQCTCGSEPSELVVDPIPILVEGLPAGTIADFIGGENILPFGACAIIEVCVPATMPWVVGDPTVLMNEIPSLTDISFSQCLVGAAADVAVGGAGAGMVFIIDPINTTVFV